MELGAIINSEYYGNNLLQCSLLPDIHDKCGRHNLIFQQDGAPSHTDFSIIAFLQKEHVNFIEPQAWPPNRRDYGLCCVGGLKQRVYLQCEFKNIDELKP